MCTYAVLATCKAAGSANVGDHLVLRERSDADFLTFFREASLEEHLEAINGLRTLFPRPS